MGENQQEQALKAMLEQNKLLLEGKEKHEVLEGAENAEEASQASQTNQDEAQIQAESPHQGTRRTYTYADRNAGVRDFVEAAESVPEDKLGDLARHRRSMNAELTEHIC